MLDYKLLEALAMVAREGSFEKAAKALHLTQSAVSQRIKQLEELMGQVLLARTSPPQATPAGRHLLKHYLQVKRLEDDVMETMRQPANSGFASLAVGINADSLALWFLDAMKPFLQAKQVLLEIRVDDQEQTHRLLKDGDVMGCISAQEHPVQGCRIEYLGQMNYRMMASPEYAARWFSDGFVPEAVCRAPALIFDRNDDLHHTFLRQTFGAIPAFFPAHYLPSVEKYGDYLVSGLAYGMLPDQQSQQYLQDGRLVDVVPGCHVSVKLFWHCWSLNSKLLQSFTRHLIIGAKALLAEP